MKSILLIGMLLVGSNAMASAEAWLGYVLPESCRDREAGGPETHTTECALEAECVASGFGILVDGEFIEFDAGGDEMAHRYFEGTERVDEHWVEVRGRLVEEQVHVESIEPRQR